MTSVHPRYVNDGERVLIPWRTRDRPRQGLWVTVACAAGTSLRVVNAEFGVDRWLRLDDVYVPADDPRADTHA